MTVDAATRRMSKRMEAARNRHGACCLCRHRETTEAGMHCRGNPRRAMGMCEDDGQRPRFRVDETALEAFKDAN